VSVAAGVCALALIASAAAQDAQPAPPPAEPALPGVLPPAPFQPGFIDAFGRWMEEGAAKLKSEMQSAQENLDKNLDKIGKEARETAKDATGSLKVLSPARVVSGRERCAAAPNGAPDCLAAAASVCRSKGFESGKSLDTQSEQKCPTRLLLSGKPPNDTDCATEIYVTRAVCQ
jgi:hypothetical protein